MPIPVPKEGDDEGNLILAGYEKGQMKLAEKHFKEEVKANPEAYANTTLSDYLFSSAIVMAMVKSGALTKK